MLQNNSFNHDKLLQYGFECKGKKYQYTTEIVDNQFRMMVVIDERGTISTSLYEKELNDIYTLHLASDASGKFVGRVRAEHKKVLDHITEKCSDKKVFLGDLSQKILTYAHEKYGNEPEFLWDKYPDAAVLRRKDTKKWYVLLMTIPKSKLGLEGDKKVQIIDLRYDTKELPSKVDGKQFFPGYHMNKKHWITIVLDGSVNADEICDLIDKSFLLAK